MAIKWLALQQPERNSTHIFCSFQEVNTAKNRRRNDTVESQLFKALYSEFTNPGTYTVRLIEMGEWHESFFGSGLFLEQIKSCLGPDIRRYILRLE